MALGPRLLPNQRGLVGWRWGVVLSSASPPPSPLSHHSSVLGLRSKSWAWYATRRQSHPTENVTQVADVAPFSIRQQRRSQIEDESRRDLGNVVVLGALLEALIQIVKFARC